MPASAVNRDPDTLPGDADLASSARRRRADAAAASRDSTDTEKKLARAARSAQRLAQLSDANRAGETLDLFAEDAERANQQAMNTDIRQGTLAGFELPDVFLAAVQSKSGGSGGGKREPQADAAEPVTPVQASFDDLPQEDAAPAASASAERPASPALFAASVIERDRTAAAPMPPLPQFAAPELDRARAAAFTDTIDALRAVLTEQRAATAAHARRMKLMLTFVVCAMLVTVVASIAQTTVLMRMRHDTSLQQDRIEQSMLNQQATLASLFDTDSENVAVPGAYNAPRASSDASPMQPVSTAHAAAAASRHPHHSHRRQNSTAR
jgi:hypothetical protein